MTRRCVECDQPFGADRAAQAKTCSPECADRRKRRRAADKYQAATSSARLDKMRLAHVLPQVCEACMQPIGADRRSRHPNTKTCCETCAREHHRRSMRQLAEAKRAVRRERANRV